LSNHGFHLPFAPSNALQKSTSWRRVRIVNYALVTNYYRHHFADNQGARQQKEVPDSFKNADYYH
jgi:hypothetical protein